MTVTGEQPRSDEASVWMVHPDALVVIRDDLIASANPATGRLFGHDPGWLIDRPVGVLLPTAELGANGSASPFFRARRSDGSSFVASASIVPLGLGSETLLAVIRDSSALTHWLDESLVTSDRRQAQLEARERIVESSRETLVQQLFGAGITLQACMDTNATGVSQERLERALDVLDQVMNDLMNVGPS